MRWFWRRKRERPLQCQWVGESNGRKVLFEVSLEGPQTATATFLDGKGP